MDVQNDMVPQQTNYRALFSNPSGLIIFIALVLIFGSVAFFGVQNQLEKQGSKNLQQSQQQAQFSRPVAPKTLVYGVWTADGSVINALNLNNGVLNKLAVLPYNIKKVTVASADDMYYINETDDRDHGKKITRYAVSEKKEYDVVAAAESFGIDDYVISPNKDYIATWEVSFAEGSPVLTGGKSRVYAVNISNPTDKKLLYDEIVEPNTPVHYPRAILNNGKVFADTFVPNEPNGGAGWAYGMSVVNFDGSGKQDLSQMRNGTYATQPVLSPDGTSLLFAGYDGSRGNGTTLKNGFRQALVTPNTVELLDVNTLERKKLPNLSNKNSYLTAQWDEGTEKVLLGQAGPQTGVYLYDIAAQSSKQVSVDVTKTSIVSGLTEDKTLTGTVDTSQTALSNLGANYAPLYTNFSAITQDGTQIEPFPLDDKSMQYITVLPDTYFEGVKAAAVDTSKTGQQGAPGEQTIIDLYSSANKTKDNLQLHTFLVKTNLAPVRITQQTGTPTESGKLTCSQLASQQCGGNGNIPTSFEDAQCKGMAQLKGTTTFNCYDSPLYLYGETGKNVKVTIHTPIYNETPAYTQGYDVTLQDNGKMKIDGQVYESIVYDYNPQVKKISPPKYGKIVSQKELAGALTEYAQGLGLNQRETADLLKTGRAKVTSPYVFVSFFNQQQSENILPITFNPKPDNYLNVVFYFKLLQEKPNMSVPTPTFNEPLQRHGFTAVEVSEIVE